MATALTQAPPLPPARHGHYLPFNPSFKSELASLPTSIMAPSNAFNTVDDKVDVKDTTHVDYADARQHVYPGADFSSTFNPSRSVQHRLDSLAQAAELSGTSSSSSNDHEFADMSLTHEEIATPLSEPDHYSYAGYEPSNPCTCP